jgi:hypothetical protein
MRFRNGVEETATVADRRYEMAYLEAMRSISQQQQVLNELRARTGILIAVSAISTSFLGAQAFTQNRSPGVWWWAAVVSFALTSGCAVSVLWPRRNWLFGSYAATIINDWLDRDDAPSIDQMHLQRAVYLQDDYDQNRTKLTRLFYLFAITSGFLIVEILFWLIHLWRG